MTIAGCCHGGGGGGGGGGHSLSLFASVRELKTVSSGGSCAAIEQFWKVIPTVDAHIFVMTTVVYAPSVVMALTHIWFHATAPQVV